MICRTGLDLQVNLHAQSVMHEVATTASTTMGTNTRCIRNPVRSNDLHNSDYRCAQCRGTAHPIDGRPQSEVQIRPDKLDSFLLLPG